MVSFAEGQMLDGRGAAVVVDDDDAVLLLLVVADVVDDDDGGCVGAVWVADGGGDDETPDCPGLAMSIGAAERSLASRTGASRERHRDLLSLWALTVCALLNATPNPIPNPITMKARMDMAKASQKIALDRPHILFLGVMPSAW